ncbi:hypothetical protein [Bradyrhizobium sp. HKCCYLS20291]|uniref:hypothetical protein n=1 Tax=Bradyrhizobium sp. HKCCYLS20291 TaxID=3420766 RepID=UPI003EC0C814
MFRTIRALFRIRQLMRIEQAARAVTLEIDQYDRSLNGTPPRGDDSRPPNGDDYNRILSITEDLRQVL